MSEHIMYETIEIEDVRDGVVVDRQIRAMQVTEQSEEAWARWARMTPEEIQDYAAQIARDTGRVVTIRRVSDGATVVGRM